MSRVAGILIRTTAIAIAVAAALPASAASLYDLVRASASADRRISYQGRKTLRRYSDGQEMVLRAKVYHLAPACSPS